MTELLGIFAKAPVAGRVKTRLVPPLTAEEAAAVYEASLRDVVRAGSDTFDTITIFYDDPADDGAFFRSAFPGTTLAPQAGGDLGARLQSAFQRAFESGHDRALIIGGDSPTLPPAHLLHAREALARNAAVLGPTEDGGYYLIGVRQDAWPAAAALLRGIPWSTDRVFDATLAAARQADLEVAVGPLWYDIDYSEDLARAALDALPTSSLGRLLRSHPNLPPLER